MRNNSLDILKFLCAILVIFIHTPQPGNIELLIDPLQRCAVPIFFIISGYFTFERNDLNNVLKNRIVTVLKIFCWAFALYILSHIIHYKSLYVIYIVAQNISSLFFFNNIIPEEHIWYIHAYLYVLIIFLFVNKYNLYKPLLYATPILMVAGLFLGKYHEIITGNNIPIFYSRNFLFTGLPFFFLGYLIKKNEKIINRYISKNTAIVGIFIFLVTGFVEEFAFGIYDNTGDLYISSAFMSTALFILFLKIDYKKENFVSKIGKNDCLYIYIFHIFLLNEISFLMTKLGYEALFQHMSIIIVLITTIIFIKFLRKTQIIGKLI